MLPSTRGAGVVSFIRSFVTKMRLLPSLGVTICYCFFNSNAPVIPIRCHSDANVVSEESQCFSLRSAAKFPSLRGVRGVSFIRSVIAKKIDSSLRSE